MASVQSHKPSDETEHLVQALTYYEKTTTVETQIKNNTPHNNEHSFTSKVKEMAHRIFPHHDQHQGSIAAHGGHPAPNLTQKTNNYSTGTAKTAKTEKKTNKEHAGHCMPKAHEQMKNMKKKIMKKKDKKHSDHNSDSGSSSDSDKEAAKKKN